jgi:RNA polymerase sigma-70 factor (ECF subfamily)
MQSHLDLPDIPVAPGDCPEAIAVYPDWVDLVERIRVGETDGMQELYQLFAKGLRYHLSRQVGSEELEDKIHDTFVVVVQAIRKGEFQEPSRLMGLVRTIVRRQVGASDDDVIGAGVSALHFASPGSDTEEAAFYSERRDLIQRVLDELPERDRELLSRFYLKEEDQETICRVMGLSEAQFRILTSRAKARFGALGKKLLANKKSPSAREESEQHMEDISRLVPVIAHAVAVFGDEAKATHWFATALPLLGGRSPKQLLSDPANIPIVDGILTRIEHNIPS